jgi:hypothetical protein
VDARDSDSGGRGPAETHRATAAGLAELAEHHADAVAALDRALVARLGELDRAIDVRTTRIDSRVGEAESALHDAIESGVGAFKRAGSDERRLLHEAVAAHLADVERVIHERMSEFDRAAWEQLDALRQRVGEVERAAARVAELEDRLARLTPPAAGVEIPGRGPLPPS